MMFRSKYRPYILPIPENWIHDGWIAFIVGALAPVGLVERCTVKYRQHAAQQIGGKKLTLSELYEKAREVGPPYYRLAYEQFVLAQERLRLFSPRLRDPRFLDQIDQIVPPGTDVGANEANYTPPSLVKADLRSRPSAERAAVKGASALAI